MDSKKIEKEARDLLRRFRDLREFDKACDKMTAKYGADNYLAIRKQYALLWLDYHGKHPIDDPELEKRKKNKARKEERKKKLKEGTLVVAKKTKSKKRDNVTISLPSSKRYIQNDDDEHTLPSAKIIYTPMGNKR